jgi:hypothetical protein
VPETSSVISNVVVVVKTDVKQIDVHAERLHKCAIVQILLVKVISIMSKSFLNPMFVLSLGSSTVLIFEIISSGKEDEVRSTFASTNTHSCSKCSNTVHVICGKTIGEEGFGRSVLGFFKMWLLW